MDSRDIGVPDQPHIRQKFPRYFCLWVVAETFMVG
jgi:hypothetical protein